MRQVIMRDTQRGVPDERKHFMAGKFEVYKDKTGEFRFRLKVSTVT